jgi:hypothetical protein
MTGSAAHPSNQDGSDGQDEEKGSKDNRNTEERLLDAAPGCKEPAGICTGQAAKASALALQDDADDQGD